MKIKLCCPFYNENLIAGVNINESSKWVDEIHITEANKSFKYTSHDYCFNQFHPKVFYHQLNVDKKYKNSRKCIPYIDFHPISRWMKNMYFNTSWHNEAVSRNYTLFNSEHEDNDILILSDIDEIINSDYADFIIEETKKYGIVTLEIYFTMFYFNLFCHKWAGPQNYSYRIFCVKGNVMRRKFNNDSDYLRKLGEQSCLLSDVKCLKGFLGYHHSWLGDEKFILNKLYSYAHSTNDHDQSLMTNGEYDFIKIKKCIAAGKSLFPGINLEKNDSILLLPIIEKLRVSDKQYFI